MILPSEKFRHALKSYLESALRELAEHRAFVVGLVVLGLAVIAPSVFAQGHKAGPVAVVLFLSAGLVLLAFVQRYLFFIACLVLVPANLIFVHLKHHWGGEQLVSRIEAAFESPPREALEYLETHMDAVDAAVIVFFICYLVVLIGVIFRTRRPRLPALRKIAAIALIIWLALVAVFRLDVRFKQFPPYQLGTEIVQAKARFELLRGRHNFLIQHPLATTDCSSKYDKVVIVLGESAISDHMSVFGYGKATTPFAVQSEPHAFDALAPSNQTRYSLPMMLSDASPGRFDIFYRQHSLVGQLRACGYHTMWISNQGRVGVYDSLTTALAMEADEQIFLNEWSWTETHYDGQIVQELAARDIFAKRNQVTFIHLIGSHTRYDERYPKGFGFSNVQGTVAQYDNSLLYTDHVLSELYKNFAGESLLFIYVSDHGQFVSEKQFGSGFLPGFQAEYRIPLLIWSKDAAAIEKIRLGAANSKLNMDSLSNIVRFLLGDAASPELSTSRAVSVLTPDNVRIYDDLQAFTKK